MLEFFLDEIGDPQLVTQLGVLDLFLPLMHFFATVFLTFLHYAENNIQQLYLVLMRPSTNFCVNDALR